MIAGGAAAEAEVSQKLAQYAKTISGIESECINAYAEVRSNRCFLVGLLHFKLTKHCFCSGSRGGTLYVGAKRRS